MSVSPIDRGGSRDTGDLGVVRITAKEIYDAVMHLTGQVATAITLQRENQETLKDHEARIRASEQAHAKFITIEDLNPIKLDVAELKSRRWPIPVLTAVIAVITLVFLAIDIFIIK